MKGPSVRTVIILLTVCIEIYDCLDCQEYGRFPDEEDCRKYVLCAKTSQGENLTMRFTCYEGTAFNPDKSRCEDDFRCSKDTFECSSPGRFPETLTNDCSSYFLCIKLYNGYLPLKFTCPGGARFDPDLRNCKYSYAMANTVIPSEPELYTTMDTTIGTEMPITTTDIPIENTTIDITTPTTTPITTPTTTLPTTPITTPRPFVCTAVGRYPDPSSKNCKGYILCVFRSSNTFAQYRYICPNTSKFNPIIKQCSYIYTCLDSTTTVQPVETTTPKQEQSCTSAGRFPDPLLSDCSGYIICESLPNEGFKQTNYKCRPKASYNPIIGQCSFIYKCIAIAKL